MKRNWLEWSILAGSVAVVAALVGYLLFTGLSDSGPAVIRAEVADGANGPDGGWLVPLTVRNEGGRAAVSIVVEGMATVAGSEESSEVTIDLLAADSEVELTLGYSEEPEDEIQLRVVGFESP